MYIYDMLNKCFIKFSNQDLQISHTMVGEWSVLTFKGSAKKSSFLSGPTSNEVEPCLCFDLLICQTVFLFEILNWNFRYLAWQRQYQTEIFVLLKQCYYGAALFTKFCLAWPFFPSPPIQVGLNIFVEKCLSLFLYKYL